ncbi:hypothetical protein BJV74DRAFT_392049 [Russula compacta]|nr:hypothetical protein BJV74DRAFT_392049 [Russula compacta]
MIFCPFPLCRKRLLFRSLGTGIKEQSNRSPYLLFFTWGRPSGVWRLGFRFRTPSRGFLLLLWNRKRMESESGERICSPPPPPHAARWGRPYCKLAYRNLVALLTSYHFFSFASALTQYMLRLLRSGWPSPYGSFAHVPYFTGRGVVHGSSAFVEIYTHKVRAQEWIEEKKKEMPDPIGNGRSGRDRLIGI